MTILDGNKLSAKKIAELRKRIEEKKLKLKLAVILVGNNMVSKSYISKKEEACRECGIEFEIFNFSPDIDEEELKKEISKICDDKNNTAVVIQLPIPKKLDVNSILNLIPPEKDADVLSENSFENFSKNELQILPPVVNAVKNLFEEYKIDISGKKIVLIGKGRLVGKPLSEWFLNNCADFEILDRSVSDIKSHTGNADIIISGAGNPGLIKEDMIKEGVILIDAGTSSEDGKIKGDIEKTAYKKASFVAPAPGGVGPMTVACLLENVARINN